MNNLDFTKDNQTETHEQRLIRLLTLLTEAVSPVSTDETWLLVDLAALAELETAGFISAGQVVRDGTGQVCAIACMSINLRGRAYLAELQQEAVADTSAGFIKEHRFSFYKWFFGIVGAIIAGYFVWFITHH
jgi:hypothetical protein